jgi:hypothetical protein
MRKPHMIQSFSDAQGFHEEKSSPVKREARGGCTFAGAEADLAVMTRFQPPKLPPASAANITSHLESRPRPLPAVRGMSVCRTVVEGGQLETPLPWSPGTVVRVCAAGGENA